MAYVLFLLHPKVILEHHLRACVNFISAALGMAVAAKKHGENNRHVVVVIGDGSMSGGLAFEGLNNAWQSKYLLII